MYASDTHLLIQKLFLMCLALGDVLVNRKDKTPRSHAVYTLLSKN